MKFLCVFCGNFFVLWWGWLFVFAFSTLEIALLRLYFLTAICGSISLVLSFVILCTTPELLNFISQNHSESKRHARDTTGRFSELPCDPVHFSPIGTADTDLSAGISRDDQPLPAHPDNLHRLCGSFTSANSGTCTNPTWFQPPAQR